MTKKLKTGISMLLALGTIASMSTLFVSAGCGQWVLDPKPYSTYCATPICKGFDIPTYYVAKKYTRSCKSEYGTDYNETKIETEKAGCC